VRLLRSSSPRRVGGPLSAAVPRGNERVRSLGTLRSHRLGRCQTNRIGNQAHGSIGQAVSGNVGRLQRTLQRSKALRSSDRWSLRGASWQHGNPLWRDREQRREGTDIWCTRLGGVTDEGCCKGERFEGCCATGMVGARRCLRVSARAAGNVADPMTGCRVQQTCRVSSGVNRRSREERQGRNASGCGSSGRWSALRSGPGVDSRYLYWWRGDL